MKTPHLIAAAILSLAGVAAFAQNAASAPGTDTPRIDQRQANQEKRIDQGIASGQLNKRESVASSASRRASTGPKTRQRPTAP